MSKSFDYEIYEQSEKIVTVGIFLFGLALFCMVIGMSFGHALLGLIVGLGIDFFIILFLLAICPPQFMVEYVYNLIKEKGKTEDEN